MAAKLQSSTEFLAILAAVAAFSVAVLAVYVHFGSDQSALYSRISRLSGNQIGGVGQNFTGRPFPEIYVVAPNTTTVNKSASIYLVVSGPGDINVKANASGYYGISVYPSYQNATINGFGILQFTAVAGSTGEKVVSVNASASYNGTTITKAASVRVLAVQEPGQPANLTTQNASFAGSILENGQEAIGYQVSKPNEVSNVTYWSHCAYIGFFGGVLPEPEQCGSNTWGFDTGDSSCNVFAYDGDNRYYCFALQSDDANASQIGQQSRYIYNASLYIRNSTLSLHANFTNNKTESALTSGNGGDYGYAEVTSTYAPDVYPVPYLSYAVLGRGGRAYPVNISAYSAYSGLYGQVIQLLDIYNSSGGADLGYLEGLIAELNKSAGSLIGSKQVNSSICTLIWQQGSPLYLCETHDLSYGITVHLNGSEYTNVNKTVYIGSSVVRVIG